MTKASKLPSRPFRCSAKQSRRLNGIFGCAKRGAMATLLLASTSLSTASAEQIISKNDVSASLPHDYQCGPQATVRLDAASEEKYLQSRVDMEKLAATVQAYLWIDCDQVETIVFEGFVGEEKVYAAKVNKSDEWLLTENTDPEPTSSAETDEAAAEEAEEQEGIEANAAPDEPSEADTAQTATEPAEPAPQLEALEAATGAGSQDAQLELAKGLLDLPTKDEAIDFPADQARGIELLETLAEAGNADAMHALGSAYLQSDDIEVNEALVEKVTSHKFTEGQDTRAEASAALMFSAAANGSVDALQALFEAGEAGSASAFYALGTMYLFDQQGKLPYESDVLENKFGYGEEESEEASQQQTQGQAGGQTQEQTQGQPGNVDMGLHFLTMAAEQGEQNAQDILSDLGIGFEPAEPNDSEEQAGLPMPPFSGTASSGEPIPPTALPSTASATPPTTEPADPSTASAASADPAEAAEPGAAGAPSEEPPQEPGAQAAEPNSGAQHPAESAMAQAAENLASYAEKLAADGAIEQAARPGLPVGISVETTQSGTQGGAQGTAEPPSSSASRPGQEGNKGPDPDGNYEMESQAPEIID